jgi:cation:H+ antiporter
MELFIPELWFAEQHSAILILLVAIFFGVLIKAADWVVVGASSLAYRLGMPKVIVGATIVSLGTTSPEAAVSVTAAWSGNSGLSLGNAVGSIIVDTGLIFGLGCMLTPLPADQFVLRRQGWVQFGCGWLLAALCYGAYLRDGDGATLGRGVGLFFLLILVWYLYVSVGWAKAHRRTQTKLADPDPHQVLDPIAPSSLTTHTLPTVLSMVIVGLALVIVSSRMVVQSVSELADRWGVPDVVIAATLVAAGTSLPEMIVGLSSIRRGHAELLVGNVIGADILNVLFVVGASAAAAELPLVELPPGAPAPYIFLSLHLPVMLLILGLFRILIVIASRRGRFVRAGGLPLFLIYVTFVVLSALLGH